MPGEHQPILEKITALYKEIFKHDGYGEIRITMRFLKRHQKEIIIHCGKEYRFVVDYPQAKLSTDHTVDAEIGGQGGAVLTKGGDG